MGVVRIANIKPCIELTKYLLTCELPENTEIRTMAYHSQQVLLMRHDQEKYLDSVFIKIIIKISITINNVDFAFWLFFC
jgi:hypothetical protein